MNERFLSRACLAISIVGLLLIVPFGRGFLEERSVGEMLAGEGEKGIVFGRVEFVIRNDSSALFVISDGNKGTVYHPKPLEIERNSFVTVYGESQKYEGKLEIYAYRVVVE